MEAKINTVNTALILMHDEVTQRYSFDCFPEITPDELQTIQARYPVGTHLWRALMYHFTPYDCNFPYGPPPCAAGPGDSDPLPGIL